MNTAAATTKAQEAADWYLRLAEDATEDELRAWVEWCAADPANLKEFERTRDTWQAFDGLEPQALDLLSHLEEKTGPRARAKFAIAASILIVTAAAGWWAIENHYFSPNKRVFTARETVNESTTLPDGSTLTLAPRTNVAMDFSGKVRGLELSQGEAYFKVSPNKTKPFIVHAASFSITALGTAFNIKSTPDRIIVTVQEGLVEAARGTEKWRVAAGYQLKYDLARRTTHIAAIDPERELTWKEGRLEYFLEPLENVVSDANRYTHRHIEITDPKIAQITYSGTIFTQSIDDWLQAVETTFPVTVTAEPDRVTISARTD